MLLGGGQPGDRARRVTPRSVRAMAPARARVSGWCKKIAESATVGKLAGLPGLQPAALWCRGWRRSRPVRGAVDLGADAADEEGRHAGGSCPAVTVTYRTNRGPATGRSALGRRAPPISVMAPLRWPGRVWDRRCRPGQ